MDGQTRDTYDEVTVDTASIATASKTNVAPMAPGEEKVEIQEDPPGSAVSDHSPMPPMITDTAPEDDASGIMRPVPKPFQRSSKSPFQSFRAASTSSQRAAPAPPGMPPTADQSVTVEVTEDVPPPEGSETSSKRRKSTKPSRKGCATSRHPSIIYWPK